MTADTRLGRDQASTDTDPRDDALVEWAENGQQGPLSPELQAYYDRLSQAANRDLVEFGQIVSVDGQKAAGINLIGTLVRNWD